MVKHGNKTKMNPEIAALQAQIHSEIDPIIARQIEAENLTSCRQGRGIDNHQGFVFDLVKYVAEIHHIGHIESNFRETNLADSKLNEFVLGDDGELVKIQGSGYLGPNLFFVCSASDQK